MKRPHWRDRLAAMEEQRRLDERQSQPDPTNTLLYVGGGASIALGGWEQAEACMTGDGNPPAFDVDLCRECLERPYGTVGELDPNRATRCSRCWTPRLIWFGNQWSPRMSCRHYADGEQPCDCTCHVNEVVLA